MQNTSLSPLKRRAAHQALLAQARRHGKTSQHVCDLTSVGAPEYVTLGKTSNQEEEEVLLDCQMA